MGAYQDDRWSLFFYVFARRCPLFCSGVKRALMGTVGRTSCILYWYTVYVLLAKPAYIPGRYPRSEMQRGLRADIFCLSTILKLCTNFVSFAQCIRFSQTFEGGSQLQDHCL